MCMPRGLYLFTRLCEGVLLVLPAAFGCSMSYIDIFMPLSRVHEYHLPHRSNPQGCYTLASKLRQRSLTSLLYGSFCKLHDISSPSCHKRSSIMVQAKTRTVMCKLRRGTIIVLAFGYLRSYLSSTYPNADKMVEKKGRDTRGR